MCYNSYKGTFLNFVSVRKTCFVLAIINAIANGLSLVYFSFVGFAALLLAILTDGKMTIKIGGVRFKRSLEEDIKFNYWIPYPYLMTICGLFSLITFILSVILCYGINHRRWNLVKAYFNYGCVIVVLALVSTIIQAFIDFDWDLVAFTLTGCALHTLFLALVFATYKQLFEEATISDRSRLVDMKDIRV